MMGEHADPWDFIPVPFPLLHCTLPCYWRPIGRKSIILYVINVGRILNLELKEWQIVFLSCLSHWMKATTDSDKPWDKRAGGHMPLFTQIIAIAIWQITPKAQWIETIIIIYCSQNLGSPGSFFWVYWALMSLWSAADFVGNSADLAWMLSQVQGQDGSRLI